MIFGAQYFSVCHWPKDHILVWIVKAIEPPFRSFLFPDTFVVIHMMTHPAFFPPINAEISFFAKKSLMACSKCQLCVVCHQLVPHALSSGEQQHLFGAP